MAASRTRSSEIVSRRKIERSKELWIDYFRDALASLLSSDNETIKEFTEDESACISLSCGRIADACLKQTEERFPGL